MYILESYLDNYFELFANAALAKREQDGSSERDPPVLVASLRAHNPLATGARRISPTGRGLAFRR